jgi:ferric-dicitrate binding protein FerR (iron transport regulator)
MLRQTLAVTLSILLSAPVWAISSPLGAVVSGNGVSVAGASAADGSSLYNGDTLAVQSNGSASLILSGGSQARMAGNSQARLSRNGSAIALELLRGKLQFTSSGKSPVEGQVADVTLRPENSTATSVAFMTLDDAHHTVLYAEQGDWIVSSAHDGHSLILRPGEHIAGLLTAAQDQDQNTPQGQQNKKKKRKWAVIWIGSAIAGTATGLGLAFGMSECTTTSDPHCQLTPVTPQ